MASAADMSRENKSARFRVVHDPLGSKIFPWLVQRRTFFVWLNVDRFSRSEEAVAMCDALASGPVVVHEA